jgi:Holliday junction resolvase RusA-like endonuclease
MTHLERTQRGVTVALEGPRAFTVTLPILPPPLNNAYINIAGRGRILSPAAREWKDTAVLQVRNAMQHIGWTCAPKTDWHMVMELVHPKVHAWDLDGRLKFLIDVLADVIGSDDRYLMSLFVVKRRGPEQVLVRVVRADS